MNINQFPVLKTERLLLRKLKESDWEIISYLRSDKEVNKFVKRSSAESKEKALEFITKISTGIDNQVIFYWAITEIKDQMIGSICLWNFSEDQKTAEVGYDLSPKFHGNGVMDEAMKSVIEYGFNVLNLDKIEAYTHQKNESSKKLLERNRFTFVKDKIDENNLNNIIYELKQSFVN